MVTNYVDTTIDTYIYARITSALRDSNLSQKVSVSGSPAISFYFLEKKIGSERNESWFYHQFDDEKFDVRF